MNPFATSGTYIPNACATIPSAQEKSIPKRMAPLSFFTTSKPVKIVPTSAIIAQIPCVANGTSVKCTIETSVAGLSTTIPAVFMAMMQMKSPIPAATAFFSGNGMLLKIASRTGVSESARNTSPSTNTASSANCQL